MTLTENVIHIMLFPYIGHTQRVLQPTLKIQLSSKNQGCNRYCTRLMSMVDLMYLETILPCSFQDYAAITASYTLNHTPNSSRQKTSFEIWMGYKETLAHLRVWGCEVYPHVSDKDQYDKDMERYFLIGYPQGEKGYLLQRKSRDEIITCRIGDFLEDSREDKQEEEAEAEAEWEGWQT